MRQSTLSKIKKNNSDFESISSPADSGAIKKIATIFEENGAVFYTNDFVTKKAIATTPIAVEINAPASAIQGTLTDKQLSTLQASDDNYIVFDHEYYKISTKGRVEGYRTYYCPERENNKTSIKTITITESTKAWVLFDLDVEEAQKFEAETVTPEMWQDLNGNEPFAKMASVTLSTTISANSTVELINDQAVAFANYGFNIGMINEQRVVLFALDSPTNNITFTFSIRG